MTVHPTDRIVFTYASGQLKGYQAGPTINHFQFPEATACLHGVLSFRLIPMLVYPPPGDSRGRGIRSRRYTDVLGREGSPFDRQGGPHPRYWKMGRRPIVFLGG